MRHRASRRWNTARHSLASSLQSRESGKGARWTVLVALVLFGWYGVSPVEAVPSFAPGFVQDTVVSGLDGPIAADWALGGRIYIAQKSGLVRVFDNGSLLAAPFIDLTAEVNTPSDRGLLSIALHPQFPDQPYVYLYYNYDHPGATKDATSIRTARLIRVTATAASDFKRADPNSIEVIVGKNSTARYATSPACQEGNLYVNDCIPTDDIFHNGGHLEFAADGSLFLSTGDGYDTDLDPNTVRVLDIDSLAGKLLRINPVTGDGVSSNPFFNPANPSSNRSRVYSYGLRNPFRFGISPSNGVPYIGEVGHTTWEEINAGKGANFGWPCYEGGIGVNEVFWGHEDVPRCQALYSSNETITPPIHAYDTTDISGSVIGGAFYTGSSYPAQYRGAQFFADYSQGYIKYLTFDESGAATAHNFASGLAGPVHLPIGPDSNLWYVDINDGAVRRIRFVEGGNTPPTAVASATPTAGIAPLTVQFTGEDSFDPDNDPISFFWAFGDGSSSSSVNPNHRYRTDGTYNAKLTVTDERGSSTTATIEVVVGNAPPTATILSPLPGDRFQVGDVVNFRGQGSDPETGALNGASLAWEVVLHHETHIHFDYFEGTGETGSFTYADHDDDSYLELCLTVTDPAGLQDQDCVDVRLEEVTYTFTSNPAGLDVNYFGQRRTTPFSVTTYVNATRSVSVPQPQDGFIFDSWSDGGAASHSITIGSTAHTVTANFEFSTNNPPEVVNPGNQTDTEGSTVSLDIAASDADDDTLNLKAGGLPANLTINSATGQITGTLAASSAGNYTVTVTANDGSGGSDSETFEWTVLGPPPPNNPPEVSNPGNQVNEEGQVVSLPISASDLDGDTLLYSAIGLPPGLSINSDSGVISGTLGTGDGSTGDFNVTASVSDGIDTVSVEFLWTVKAVSDPPGVGRDRLGGKRVAVRGLRFLRVSYCCKARAQDYALYFDFDKATNTWEAFATEDDLLNGVDHVLSGVYKAKGRSGRRYQLLIDPSGLNDFLERVVKPWATEHLNDPEEVLDGYYVNLSVLKAKMMLNVKLEKPGDDIKWVRIKGIFKLRREPKPLEDAGRRTGRGGFRLKLAGDELPPA